MLLIAAIILNEDESSSACWNRSLN